MTPETLEQFLVAIENQCAAVALTLSSGNAQAVEPASDELRRAALQFSQLMRDHKALVKSSPRAQLRLQNVARQISLQRVALLRWLSMTERTVEVLLPGAVRKDTYSAPPGRASLYRRFSA
jgi:hypothetical protein